VLKTFPKGGVHPSENKFSEGKAIIKLPIPETVFIPVSQHIGAPSEPVVQKGDSVKVGQLIAKSTGFVSANIHSSVSGKVLKIEPSMDASGYKRMGILIQVDGDESDPSIDWSPDLIKSFSSSSDEIRKIIAEKGIVGLGGATFPTHVKMSVPQGKTAEHLVINAVECEPFLTADHQLMMEKTEEILVGCQIMAKAIDVKNILIGIENNKPDAIEIMKEKAQQYDNIEVFALKVQYPQGGEKQLIKALLNREVPSGGLPIDVGCVVQNVGTAFAVYEAVQKNKPLIERVVTVTGEQVKNPINVLAKIGTSISILIEAAGGLPEDTGKIVNGGPMMGKAVNTTDIPVTKGTSGILLFSNNQSKRPDSNNCIRCARCATACPMCLEPYLLKNMANQSLWEDLEKERVLDCIECGSCSYTCPAGIALLDYIRLGKSNVNRIIRSRKS
jgi:electron transport complex protein RnfC